MRYHHQKLSQRQKMIRNPIHLTTQAESDLSAKNSHLMKK